MLDILLINPGFFSPSEMNERSVKYREWIQGGNMYVYPYEPPLGLASLAASLKSRTFNVDLLDAQGLLLTDAEIIKYIKQHPARHIGITAMTSTLNPGLSIARLIKKKFPSIKIIFGGVHPTIDPFTLIKNPIVDYIVRGEGEITLRMLLSGTPPNKIPGVCFHSNNGKDLIHDKAPVIRHLNEIPFPDYDCFPIEKYIDYNKKLRGIRGISMLVSRGCPYRCSFCAVKETMAVGWRIHSPELVVDQMEDLKDRFGVQGIWFKDSVLNLKREWMLEFIEEMLRRDLRMEWQFNTRVDLVREDELKLAKKAGCVQVDFGIEAGSARMLQKLKKNIAIEQIEEAVSLAKKYVKVAGFFMIGIPGETREEISATFKLAKRLQLDKSCWSIFTPLPGSELYNELVLEKRVQPSEQLLKMLHFTMIQESYCEVPANELKELYNKINSYFYTQSN